MDFVVSADQWVKIKENEKGDWCVDFARKLKKAMVWFLCLIAYQLFLGYLMPKPFSEKISSGTI